jgi:DNA-directed RNA polymerase subunit L
MRESFTTNDDDDEKTFSLPKENKTGENEVKDLLMSTERISICKNEIEQFTSID